MDPSHWTFSHAYFTAEHPEWLSRIQRKVVPKASSQKSGCANGANGANGMNAVEARCAALDLTSYSSKNVMVGSLHDRVRDLVYIENTELHAKVHSLSEQVAAMVSIEGKHKRAAMY